MKTLLSDTILMAAISACLSLLFIYFIVSTWGGNGFSELELILILIIPGLLFFIVTLFINLFLLRRYRKDALESPKQTHWGKIFVILSVLVIFFSLVIDYLYNSINNNLSHQLGTAMGQMLLEVGSSQKEVQAFSKMPIFLQGFIPNALGIIFGCFFASYFTRRVNRNKEKHQMTV